MKVINCCRRTTRERYRVFRQEASHSNATMCSFCRTQNFFLKQNYREPGKFCCMEDFSLLTASIPEVNLDPIEGESSVNEPLGRKIWAFASGEVCNSYSLASLNNHMIRDVCPAAFAGFGEWCTASHWGRGRVPSFLETAPYCEFASNCSHLFCLQKPNICPI